MVTITRTNSPLVSQPLKTSPGTGATLASMGFHRTIPLMHGSQGCSAFTKVYLIQHLREPIPLQNTAIDQVSAVMGGDENLGEALKLLCEKQHPEMIAVMTTGLTEMQGTDICRAIADFKRQHPQFFATRIVSMTTPDFVGSMQTGYCEAVRSVVKQLVQEPTKRPRQRQQVNVLCSLGMTAADIETIKQYIEAFELDAVIVPDLSLSLDGHLSEEHYCATSTGGTSVLEVELMSDSVMTFVLGDGLADVGKWLQQRFDIPYQVFGMGMSMDAVDEMIMALSRLSKRDVPAWMTRSRQRLQDALLDTHFLLSGEEYVIALEPDLAKGYAALLASVGGHISQLVTTIDAPNLGDIKADEVIIGDLSSINLDNPDLKLVISNTHAAQKCEPAIPVLRAGYPCHDQYGNMDVRQFGYEGMRERLFALANLLLRNHRDEVPVHSSAYRFGAEDVISKEVR